MKVLGIIFLVVIGFVALVNMGDSDEPAKAQPAPTAAAAPVNDDASEAYELSQEGVEITDRIQEWSNKGATGDLAGACSELDVARADLGRLTEIVDEMSRNDAIPALTVVKLRTNQSTLNRHFATVESGCAELGF